MGFMNKGNIQKSYVKKKIMQVQIQCLFMVKSDIWSHEYELSLVNARTPYRAFKNANTHHGFVNWMKRTFGIHITLLTPQMTKE